MEIKYLNLLWVPMDEPLALWTLAAEVQLPSVNVFAIFNDAYQTSSDLRRCLVFVQV